jgi:hypothetical protein
VDTEEIEALDPLHYSPQFTVVHDQLLCLADIEGEVVVLAIAVGSRGANPEKSELKQNTYNYFLYKSNEPGLY